MRTWEDYKNHVKAVSEEERRNMEEIEEVSDIVSSIIRRRQEASAYRGGSTFTDNSQGKLDDKLKALRKKKN